MPKSTFNIDNLDGEDILHSIVHDYIKCKKRLYTVIFVLLFLLISLFSGVLYVFYNYDVVTTVEEFDIGGDYSEYKDNLNHYDGDVVNINGSKN